MRRTRNALVLLLLFVCCTGSVRAQQPFTYQGMLKVTGVPANGNYDFQFSLWTASAGGAQVGSTLTKSTVSVQHGLFSLELDFGSVWDGSDRFLQIAVRPAGSGSYTTLSPRVKVNRVPYSQLAYSALTVPWSGIVGVPGSFPPGGPAGGDLSGTYPNPTVVGVQGRPVASTAPAAGQVLKWDGARWSPADDLRDALWQVSGSDIFYNAGRVGIGTGGPLYSLHVETAAGDRAVYGLHTATSGTTTGGWFENASPWGRGVFGSASASTGYTTGVHGQSASTSGRGVFGAATAASGSTTGGWFESASTSGRGVFGFATASTGYTTGVQGQSSSPNGTGVVGYATASSGETTGVFGRSDSISGTGVYGIHAATSGTAPGVRGVTNSTSSEAVGVLGEVNSTSPGASSVGVRGINRGTGGSGIGVWGSQDGSGYGVYGLTVSGTGVVGRATSTSAETYGGRFVSDSTVGTGVYGLATATSGYTHGVYGESRSTMGDGVFGSATATSGYTYGGRFVSESSDGAGVYGLANATGGTTYGVYGRSNSVAGRGVYGWASASSGSTTGVYGSSSSTSGRGVYGVASASSGETYGVYGLSYSPSGAGVFGWAIAGSGITDGVRGRANSPDGAGVYGWATHTTGLCVGVYGESDSANGWAVYASGRFAATGTKSFQIDHPLDPENAFLNHYSAEGPEPYNIYRGTVVLDARGEAWIQLPDYFEAINRDPSYHLTAVGAPMPNLHVAVEIQGNRFKVAGGVAGKKVSWEVKAVRNDRWVQEYGFQTEQPKPPSHRGKYVHPELYGQPKQLGIHYRQIEENEPMPPEHTEK